MRAKVEHKVKYWIIRIVEGLDHDDGSDALCRKGEKASNYVLQQDVRIRFNIAYPVDMFVYPAVPTCLTSYTQFLPLYHHIQRHQSTDLQETSAVKLFSSTSGPQIICALCVF